MYGLHHVMDSMSPTTAPEVRAIRKWFFVAFVVSLVIHGLLYEAFRTKKLERFAFNDATPRLVPRPFTVNKVVINEDLLKPEKAPAETKRPDPQKTVIQTDKPSADKLPNDVRLTPTAPPAGDLTKALVPDKPRVDAGKVITPETNAQVEREINSLREQAASKAAPKIVAGEGAALPGSKGDGDGGPGFSNLDTLLAQSGPLTGSVAPVNMPGGALFEYDSAALRDDAIETLRKIGTLIGRNPRATFSIEGHTDTFGTPEYNQKLSQARAEAVKTWLVANMKLDPARIHTKGFGSRQLIVTDKDASREKQAPNRRVEIMIRTPKD